MSFWKHNPSSSPQLDAILAKKGLTLEELFEQDCLFQELKSGNKPLLDFITRNDILSELVRLVIEEPSSNVDEKEKYKYANLACEVLTTDIPAISEKLSKTYLAKLYSFLESDPPLNPLLASFFSRTLCMLFCRKHGQPWYSYQYTCLQVLDFLKSQTKSLDLLIKHLGTSAVMELTLKLLTQVEGLDLQNTLINLLENEGLIDNLMGLFEPSVDEDRHYNVSALLCETIHKAKDDLNNSGENGEKRRDTNPILEKIQSANTVEKLLQNCFGEEVSESSIVGGISVLLALLCPPPSTNINRRGCSDELASGSGDSLQAMSNQMNLLPILFTILPYLPRLHQLLINPPKKEAIKLACGTVDPPLGQARLSIIKLLATLISTNTPEVNAKLDELNTVQILLDLFFQYTWNNFLHAQVEKCLALALNSSSNESAQSNPLLPNIFVKCQILQKILSAWEENETEQSKGNRRRGYMGHLISIANNVDKQSQDDNLNSFIKENVDSETLESWKQFVMEVLTPINDIHSKCLGGQHPAQVSDDDEVNMKGTFDMQEPLIKLQTPEDADFTQPDNSMITIRVYDSTNVPQADYAAIIENILPNLQEHLTLNIREELFDNLYSSWGNMIDYKPSEENPCNSSDEELNDDEDNAVWSTCSTGSPLLDGGNPWGGLDSASCDAYQTEGWANFDSNFSQGFPSDPIQFSQVHPLSHTQNPLSNDLESGVSSLVGDDEDCNPPTEFEFEDSVEPDEDAFEPAVNSVEPNVMFSNSMKLAIDHGEKPMECLEYSECSLKQEASINLDVCLTSDAPLREEISIKELTEPGDSNANITQSPVNDTQVQISTIRLLDKAETAGSSPVKQLVSDEKENKVPENRSFTSSCTL